MSPLERLFFGVSLTTQARDRIAGSLAGLEDLLPGRPAPPRNWHITLRFLGDTGGETKEALIRALAGAPLPSAFEIGFAGWGAFPGPARARVLWIGVADPAAELTRLAAGIETAARAAAVPPETRPFRPHLTLARFRAPIDLRPLLHHLPAVHVHQRVDRFELFRSQLGTGPARYVPVHTFSLAD